MNEGNLFQTSQEKCPATIEIFFNSNVVKLFKSKITGVRSLNPGMIESSECALAEESIILKYRKKNKCKENFRRRKKYSKFKTYFLVVDPAVFSICKNIKGDSGEGRYCGVGRLS